MKAEKKKGKASLSQRDRRCRLSRGRPRKKEKRRKGESWSVRCSYSFSFSSSPSRKVGDTEKEERDMTEVANSALFLLSSYHERRDRAKGGKKKRERPFVSSSMCEKFTGR